MKCPSNPLGQTARQRLANFCICTDKVTVPGAEPRTEMEVIRQGTVDGVPVGILLDTGSTRTFVCRNLVPEVVGKTVAVSCIHGESARYPLADIDVTIGGNQFRVRAGVSDKLPVPLLLGRGVPKFSRLLGTSVGSTSSQSSVGSRSTSSESSVHSFSPATSCSLDAVKVVAVTT